MEFLWRRDGTPAGVGMTPSSGVECADSRDPETAAVITHHAAATPVSSSSAPPMGISLICLRPSLISNSSPGCSPSWAVQFNAHQQVGIELHLGFVAERAAALPSALTRFTEGHALGFQQGLVESSEVKAFDGALLGAHVTALPHQFGLAGNTELLDLGEKFRSVKDYGEEALIGES